MSFAIAPCGLSQLSPVERQIGEQVFERAFRYLRRRIER